MWFFIQYSKLSSICLSIYVSMVCYIYHQFCISGHHISLLRSFCTLQIQFLLLLLQVRRSPTVCFDSSMTFQEEFASSLSSSSELLQTTGQISDKYTVANAFGLNCLQKIISHLLFKNKSGCTPFSLLILCILQYRKALSLFVDLTSS